MFELLHFNAALQVVLPCVLTACGGLIAASLIRWHNERDPFITLLDAPAEPPSPPDPAPIAGAESFDPRPYRFQLRWNPELGTYASGARSREQNKIFRERVYNEFRLYVEYDLDTLALCDVVRKSLAFTEAERAEVIADLVKNQ
jgi:hypothetical protein